MAACLFLAAGLLPTSVASADEVSGTSQQAAEKATYAVPTKRGNRRFKPRQRSSHRVAPAVKPAIAPVAAHTVSSRANSEPAQQPAPQKTPTPAVRTQSQQAPLALEPMAIEPVAIKPVAIDPETIKKPAATARASAPAKAAPAVWQNNLEAPLPNAAAIPDDIPLAQTYTLDGKPIPKALPRLLPKPIAKPSLRPIPSTTLSAPSAVIVEGAEQANEKPITNQVIVQTDADSNSGTVAERRTSQTRRPQPSQRTRQITSPQAKLDEPKTATPERLALPELTQEPIDRPVVRPVEKPVETPAKVELAPELQPVCAPAKNSNNDPRNRRPGRKGPVIRYEDPNCDPSRLALPNPKRLNDFAAVPDRWRIVGSLGYEENLLDPYAGFNVLKGDMPVHGEWFVSLLAVLDSIYEPRSFPVPVGNATTQNSGGVDLIGDGKQTVVASNLITEFVYYRGDTVFRPPDWEFRFTPVFNINQVTFDERGLTNANPNVGQVRRDTHIGIQSAFVDYHIRNVSTRYDFDSIRVGIQPYNHDFRGFLFLDQPFGIRLFGTRNNNIFQYNIAWFRRLEKDTNSGLNDISMDWREDDVFVANIFWQDLFKLGFMSQFSLLYNRSRERDEILFDRNDFIARPASLGTERARDYDVTYLGYSGDGHFGRLNLTVSAYSALGRESNGTFNNQKSNIRAWFAAFEAGWDQDWVRYRFSFLYGSGDKDPFDDKAEGFDAVFENPIFAGADTSYWIRQTVPLIGGGRVTLSGRNGVLNSLRSSKEQGQSNFVNPGIILAGLGADLDLSTTTRLSFNFNQLWFDDSAVVEVARNQGNIDEEIGLDASAALIWRPLATQNIVFRLSGAILFPGEGFKQLFGDEDHYSVLANLLLVY